MATVQDTTNSTYRTVKNVGWLLRHSTQVTKFHIVRQPNGGAILQAALDDGRWFYIRYASFDVLWTFLHRPRWYDLPVKLDNEETAIARVNLAGPAGLI